jgi:hypothetical protein
MIHDLVGEIYFDFRPDAIVVSIAVGIHLAVLDKLLPESVVALRAMPSTPAAIKMGVTGLSRGRRASAVQFELIKKVLQTVGVVVPVEESMIDVLSSFPGLGRSTSTFWSSSSRTRPRQRASREKRLQFWLTRRSSARRIFWTRLASHRPNCDAKSRAQREPRNRPSRFWERPASRNFLPGPPPCSDSCQRDRLGWLKHRYFKATSFRGVLTRLVCSESVSVSITASIPNRIGRRGDSRESPRDYQL